MYVICGKIQLCLNLFWSLGFGCELWVLGVVKGWYNTGFGLLCLGLAWYVDFILIVVLFRCCFWMLLILLRGCICVLVVLITCAFVT